MEQKLTVRENEVKELLIQGLTYKQIADKLFVTEHTIRHYVHEILKKFELSNKMQIAYFEIKKIKRRD